MNDMNDMNDRVEAYCNHLMCAVERTRENWLKEQLMKEEGRIDFTARELADLGYKIVIPNSYQQNITTGVTCHLYKGKRILAQIFIKA